MPATKQKEESAEAATTNFAKSQLKALVERIERLEEEKKALSDDIREVYGEAKATGFDTKALRAVVRMRGQEPTERQEFEAIVDLYREALGIGRQIISAQRRGSGGVNPITLTGGRCFWKLRVASLLRREFGKAVFDCRAYRRGKAAHVARMLHFGKQSERSASVNGA